MPRSPRLPRSVAGALLALALLGTACGRSGPPSVVLILVDTLRWDHLGCTGFPGPLSPALDAVASESVLFERAYAAAPWTKPSVASLFTSLNPVAHGVLNHDGAFGGAGVPELAKGELQDGAETLAERLQALGYATAAFVANPWITAEYGFDQGFALYDDSHVGFDTPADSLVRAATAWLAGRDRSRPSFVYLHFMDVHGPYNAPESVVADVRRTCAFPSPVVLTHEDMAAIPGDVADNLWAGLDPATDRLATWQARYAAGVAHLDRQLAPFLDTLRRDGILDDAYLVVTSDHGEELFDHGGWSHGHTLYEENIRVPLIIRPPGGTAARRVERVVGLVDVLPTLVAAAGAGPAANVVGRDLAPFLRGDTVEGGGVVLSTAPLDDPRQVAVVAGRHKLILNAGTNAQALYDLVADPGERVDTAAAHPGIVRGMRAFLGRLARSQGAQVLFNANAVAVSDARRELLRSLGYTD